MLEKYSANLVKAEVKKGVPPAQAEENVKERIAEELKKAEALNYKQIIPTGAYETNPPVAGYSTKKESVVYKTKDEDLYLNSEYLNAIRKYFPRAQMRYYGKTKRVAFYQDGELKSLLLPDSPRVEINYPAPTQKETIKKAVDWVLDRIYTISGIATISLGAVLLILSHFGFTQSIPNEFSNVIVNSVILLGITILKYGQSKDNYKNISEI